VVFGRPFVKQFALCYQTVVCLSVSPVCDVGVLWPNGWTDQDETCMQVGLGPGHIVLDGDPSPLPQRGTAPQFPAHVCCGDFVLDEDPAPLHKKGAEPPSKFLAHVYCGQMAGWIKMVLGMEVGLSPGDFVLDGDQAPFPKIGSRPKIGEGARPKIGEGPQFSAESLPNFRPYLLWPNGWMRQDAT